MLAPAGEVYQAGTLSGNPLAVAAGLATLELLDEAAYARLARDHRAPRRRACARQRPTPAARSRSSSVAGLLTVFFSERPVTILRGRARRATSTRTRAWCRELLARGVYPPPSQFEAWFPSLAHGDEQIERTLAGGGGGVRRAAREERRAAMTRRGAGSSGCGALLRDGGGLIATLLGRGRRARSAIGVRRRARPRSPRPARARPAAREEYELLVEAIYEGYLLHYGEPRVAARARTPTSRCWPATACTRSGSRGSSRSATRAAVAELADMITLSALAHGAGEQRARGRPSGRPARARSAGARASAPQARQGARVRGGAPRRSRRCAQAPQGLRRRPESRLDIVRARCPTSTQSRSPSTPLDRRIPGAFEGETITRRRFMTGSAQAAGGDRGRGVPAAGARLRDRPDLQKQPGALGRRSARVDQFTDNNYVPVVLTLDPGIGEAGKTTAYVRKFNPQIDTDPYDKGTPYIAISTRCAHLGCPVRWVDAAERFICPCHGGVYDLLGRRVGGPPVRPLDRFYTRVNGENVEVGPRFSVNSELRRFSPRDPGEPLDGIGQYLYPSAPGRAETLGASARLPKLPKLPAPPLPGPLQAPPPRPGEDGAAGAAARTRQAGRHHRRRLGRRAHVAERRRPLADVPQGAEGHQLVLHARLGDDVRVPLAGRHRRVPGDVLPARPVGRRLRIDPLRHQRRVPRAVRARHAQVGLERDGDPRLPAHGRARSSSAPTSTRASSTG